MNHLFLDNFKYAINMSGFEPDFEKERVVLEMNVTDLSKFMKRYEIGYFYQRKETLKKRIPATKPKRSRLNLAGLDVYVCRCFRNKQKREKLALRGSCPSSCGCPARFTINFPYGYEHAVGDKLNVEGYGEQKVKVTWLWKHNHKFNDPRLFVDLPLARQTREMLKVAVLTYGVTWQQIKRMQSLELEKNEDLRTWELMKIKNRHVRYILYELSSSQSFKKITPFAKGFENLANTIQASGGLAEFTKEFSSLDANCDMENFRTSNGRDIWSFCFMSKWQRSPLRDNSKAIHLESTHQTCHGQMKSEDTHLFAISVKNPRTGSGAPAAFMVTNAGIGPVIADFLRKVESFTSSRPAQAFIDCDDAKTAALKSVWGPDFPIMYCRFHVEETFRIELSSIMRNFKNKELEAQISQDFGEVLASKTQAEAVQNMTSFLGEYRSYTDLVSYVNNQWFNKKKYIIEGLNEIYTKGKNSTEPIGTFHSKLELNQLLGTASDPRPDVLAHRLFTILALSYEAREKNSETDSTERSMDETETLARSKADGLSEEEARTRVSVSETGELTVNSFSDSERQYLVSLESVRGAGNTCTCPVFTNSRSLCKHIFLAMRFWHSRSLDQNTPHEISGRDNEIMNATNHLAQLTANVEEDTTVDSNLTDGYESESFFESSSSNLANTHSLAGLSPDSSVERLEEVESLLNGPSDKGHMSNTDEKSRESNISSQGPNIRSQNLLQYPPDPQVVAEENEEEKLETIATGTKLFEEAMKELEACREGLKSAEHIYKFGRMVNEAARSLALDMRNPRATQEK